MSSNIKRLCHHHRSSDGGWAADAVYLNVHVLPLMRAEGSRVCVCVRARVSVCSAAAWEVGRSSRRAGLLLFKGNRISRMTTGWLFGLMGHQGDSPLQHTNEDICAHTHTHAHEICWEQEMTGGCVMQITCEQHQNSSKQQSPSLIWQPLAGCKARLVLLSKSGLTTAQQDACVCVCVCCQFKCNLHFMFHIYLFLVRREGGWYWIFR